MRASFVVGLALCALVGLAALRTGSSTLSASTKQADIVVRSLLPKLEITEVTQTSPSSVSFVVRNGYEKDITAVITRFSPTATIRRDYVYSELDKYMQLASGASDEFWGSPAAPGKDIVISSVLFSDMTVEGDDMTEIRGVLEKRRGVKVQLARVNASVEGLASVPESLYLNEVQHLRQLVETLPIRMDDGSAISSELEHGLRAGQRMILNRLAQLETNLRDNAKVETYYTRDGQRITRTEDKEWSRQRVIDAVATFKSLEKRL